MLERRGTLRYAAERRVSQFGSRDMTLTIPVSGSPDRTPQPQTFDVDSVMRCGGQRSPQSERYAIKMSGGSDSCLGGINMLRKGSTFTHYDEEFHLSDTTYVAQLREELWQALSTHIAMRRFAKIESALECLDQVEWFWGMSGMKQVQRVRELVKDNKMNDAGMAVSSVVASMSNVTGSTTGRHHIFYVLVVVPTYNYRNPDHRVNLAAELSRLSSTEHAADDTLEYRIVEVDSVRRALLAVIVNPDILAVAIQDNVPVDHEHAHALSGFEGFVRGIDRFVDEPVLKMKQGAPILPTLIKSIKLCRKTVDIFCVCTAMGIMSLEHVNHLVTRAFFPTDDHSDLHEAILMGVRGKLRCPFFESLKLYAERPIGVFHALAISRGNSVRRSRWIQFLIDFYGVSLFKAESSATCGGLDSLLDPHGSLLEAQTLAARAYDANYAFFVTNGTSTSNKIVLQAVIRPSDVILIDRDCHKSHHYGMVLASARPCYLDAYPLHQYSMYGGVPLKDIKRTLLAYRSAGRLHEVRLLVVTNCTFDGIVYNVKRLIEECLAIKHDLIFLFDEAWFAYATFHPVLKTRTAMHCANEIRRHLMEQKYNKLHAEMLERLGVTGIDAASVEDLINHRLYPDPRHMRIRVYATQSTHKSLTSLRQGSMILVNDDMFESHVHTPFRESYYTHMSTSPNYQILATLDVGRAQMELEGYGLVERQLEAAFFIRNLLQRDPIARKFFAVLGPKDMIPSLHRQSSMQQLTEDINGNTDVEMNVGTLEQAWLSDDEFVLDPTRITLFLGQSGLDGDTFKVKWLMDKYGIQINKTSRNSVLFMTNIGTTRSSCVFLKACIRHCAQELEMRRIMSSSRELEEIKQQVYNMVQNCPRLPNFSSFHTAFRSSLPTYQNININNNINESYGGSGDNNDITSSSWDDIRTLVRDGDLRAPFYMAYDEDAVEYFNLQEAIKLVDAGEELVSSTFLIPYPPGFPIAVPGQLLSSAIIDFMIKLDVKEIHGYDPKLGLRCIRRDLLNDFIRKKKSMHHIEATGLGVLPLSGGPPRIDTVGGGDGKGASSN